MLVKKLNHDFENFYVVKTSKNLFYKVMVLLTSIDSDVSQS